MCYFGCSGHGWQLWEGAVEGKANWEGNHTDKYMVRIFQVDEVINTKMKLLTQRRVFNVLTKQQGGQQTGADKLGRPWLVIQHRSSQRLQGLMAATVMERQHSDLCFLKHGCLADLAAVPLDLPLPFGKTMLPVMLPVIVWAKQGSQERPIPAQGRAPLKSVLGLRTCEPVTTLSRAIFCRWPSYWPPGKRYHSPLTHFFSSKDGSFPQNHQNFSYNKLDSRIISAVNFKELWTKCHHPETRKRESR